VTLMVCHCWKGHKMRSIKLRAKSLAGKLSAVGLMVAMYATMGTPAQAADAKPGKPVAAARTGSAKPTKMVLEAKAMDLLKATSERLAAAKSMTFTAVASYEYPSQLGPPILYTVRYDVAMQRPDKLRVIIPGDGPASEFYYDGKTMMAFAPAENLVAVTDAPPTIDAALKAAFVSADIFYPFTDLVVADPFAALTNGATLAFYIGPSGVVGGVKTEMLAWANPDVFLQIWIGVDDKLPRRVRAVYSADPQGMRHQLDISNWQLDTSLSADAFTSAKAKAAEPMKFARPASAAPAALKPLGMTRPKPGPGQPATKSP
jgi:hypothetical protein